jgi:TolB protein
MRTGRVSVWAVRMLAGVALVVVSIAAGPVTTRRPTLELTSAPELVLPGIASSEFSEVRLAASPDGKTLLWGSTNRPGGPGGWDVWLTRRDANGWGAPQPASFNSPAKEFDPAFSPDGRYVYFFSDRPGGLGGDDIYRVPVTATGFGAVEHLGSQVNSAGNEWAPGFSPDGKTLLFATDGRGGAGRHDLFTARVEGAGFAAARALPGAINTAADEFDAAFLSDGGEVVFSRSTDVDQDPVLLYFAARGRDGYDAGTILPPTVNVNGDYTFGPVLDWADRSVLYFSGHRPEASVGKVDLYRVHFRVRP